MDNKKLILSTLAGGVTYFILGYVVYAVLMADFFAGHSSAGANALMKTDEMKFYPLFLGNVAHAALLAYVFLKWANIKSFGDGLMAGAVIGLLMAAGFDLISYDTMKLMSIVGTGVDIIVYTIMTAIVGGVIGAVVGMGDKS